MIAIITMVVVYFHFFLNLNLLLLLISSLITNFFQLYDSSGFSMINIIELMYHEDEAVRGLAGAALALFAYNNLHQQKVNI